ncbi:hypothetical protein SAMN05216585_1434 [Pseudomonas chlororaphis]|nr:hypothetical protein SAMN05216585_1434 [Pseudomonas chlororaphis]
MSRSLGLREDQQAAEALLAWIVGLLPEAPRGGHRQPARDKHGTTGTLLQVMVAPGGFKPAAGSPASKGVD